MINNLTSMSSVGFSEKAIFPFKYFRRGDEEMFNIQYENFHLWISSIHARFNNLVYRFGFN